MHKLSIARMHSRYISILILHTFSSKEKKLFIYIPNISANKPSATEYRKPRRKRYRLSLHKKFTCTYLQKILKLGLIKN